MKINKSLILLIIGFLFIFAVMILLVFTALNETRKSYGKIERVVHEYSRKRDFLSEMRFHARERTLHLQAMVLTDDPFERDEHWMAFNQNGGAFATARLNLLSMPLKPKEQQLLREQAALTHKVIPIQMRIAELASNEEVREAHQLLMGEGMALQNTVFRKIEEFRNQQREEGEKEVLEAQKANQNTRLLLLPLTATSIVVCLLIGIYLIRRTLNYADALESEVQNRTGELRSANKEIKQLNQRLHQENQRLGAEIDVARRIQEMVLPRHDELTNVCDLEIATCMEAAEEIGGDYYDVLKYPDGVKIGIGDVTGHGLESGLMMMMVQTAVRTLLESGISSSKEFLGVLNRTLYENVKRMGVDKNLTLTLLDYKTDGNLCFTGQHEEVLIIRGDKSVQRVDTITLGFMLGLRANIDDFVSHAEVHLEPGDGIVLYTDGITEAHNENIELYGLDRLCHLLSEHWHQQPKDIITAVLADVQQHVGDYPQHDDITMVILKRKEE